MRRFVGERWLLPERCGRHRRSHPDESTRDATRLSLSSVYIEVPVRDSHGASMRGDISMAVTTKTRVGASLRRIIGTAGTVVAGASLALMAFPGISSAAPPPVT